VIGDAHFEGASGGSDGAFERLLHLTVVDGGVVCGGSAGQVALPEGAPVAFGVCAADGVPVATVGPCRFAAPSGAPRGAPLRSGNCCPADAVVTTAAGVAVRDASVRGGDVVVTGPGRTAAVFGLSHPDAAAAARSVVGGGQGPGRQSRGARWPRPPPLCPRRTAFGELPASKPKKSKIELNAHEHKPPAPATAVVCRHPSLCSKT